MPGPSQDAAAELELKSIQPRDNPPQSDTVACIVNPPLLTQPPVLNHIIVSPVNCHPANTEQSSNFRTLKR